MFSCEPPCLLLGVLFVVPLRLAMSACNRELCESLCLKRNLIPALFSQTPFPHHGTKIEVKSEHQVSTVSSCIALSSPPLPHYLIQVRLLTGCCPFLPQGLPRPFTSLRYAPSLPSSPPLTSSVPSSLPLSLPSLSKLITNCFFGVTFQAKFKREEKQHRSLVEKALRKHVVLILF